MKLGPTRTFLCAAVLAVTACGPALATDWTGPAPAASSVPATPAVPTTPSSASYTPDQLDQILAPVALYPDELLSSILTAATYPLQIVEAHRWLQTADHAKLKGDQLKAAIEQKPWDPTVKALVWYPEILKMLDNNLEWTESVGDAFAANQAGVMDAVQRLRQKAQAAGHLSSNTQQTVSSQDHNIIIRPVSSTIVYVPCYSPFTVYGPWPWPGYPPYYFPDYYCDGPWLSFGVGMWIGPYWGWGYWDWPRRVLIVDSRRLAGLGRYRAPYRSGPWHHRNFGGHGIVSTAAIPTNHYADRRWSGTATTGPVASSTGLRPTARRFSGPPTRGQAGYDDRVGTEARYSGQSWSRSTYGQASGNSDRGGYRGGGSGGDWHGSSGGWDRGGGSHGSWGGGHGGGWSGGHGGGRGGHGR
jgi:hypothetical protein